MGVFQSKEEQPNYIISYGNIQEEGSIPLSTTTNNNNSSGSGGSGDNIKSKAKAVHTVHFTQHI